MGQSQICIDKRRNELLLSGKGAASSERQAMTILLAMLVGAFIGWLASLVMRTDTSEGILIDIAVGLLGAMPLAALLGNDAIFDSLLAGGLGAIIALMLLKLVRTRLRPF